MPHAEARRKIILAIDDAPENLDILKAILTPDYTVIAATNGPQALKIACARPPDLILLDVMMPGMDGYEVCRRLKDQETTRTIPVIFVSAMDQTQDETHGLDVGAVDYIAKPIRPPILRARIRTHLALAEAIGQLTQQNNALLEGARLREDVEHITRHDLKSPLSIIIGVPQLLLIQCSFTDEQREFVLMLEAAGYRMLEMINRSLDLFKMENGAYAFKPWPLDLLLVIQGVLTELGTLMAERQLSVSLMVDGAPPAESPPVMVMAESLLCHSMFSNLCKNAIEASPRGDTITIHLQRGPMVFIRIENGGAVPLAIREHFFEKFTTSGKHNGTGLGTYSAMLIAKTHHGSIRLDTSIPERTGIEVRLPAPLPSEPGS